MTVPIVDCYASNEQMIQARAFSIVAERLGVFVFSQRQMRLSILRTELLRGIDNPARKLAKSRDFPSNSQIQHTQRLNSLQTENEKSIDNPWDHMAKFSRESDTIKLFSGSCLLRFSRCRIHLGPGIKLYGDTTKGDQMKTKLHTYDYDTNDLKGFDLERLFAQLLNTPGRGRKMHAIKTQTDFDPQAGEIELEPEHLFQNQWNSSAGRVFDWCEEAIFVNGREVRNIKRGHYLDITPEMVAIRNETLKCGYTGQQFPLSAFSNGAPRFNTTAQALGSPYLKESELHLCRLLPVSEEWTTKREELTEAEREYLLPLYIAAQTKTTGKKRENQIAEIHATFEKDSKLALTERDGKLWLLSHGVPLENCIFYNHTGEFSFGWRSKFTGAAREALLAALSKFPFPYDVQ